MSTCLRGRSVENDDVATLVRLNTILPREIRVGNSEGASQAGVARGRDLEAILGGVDGVPLDISAGGLPKVGQVLAARVPLECDVCWLVC